MTSSSFIPHQSSFKKTSWAYSYKTSFVGPDGRPVDILHDFYIPALRQAVHYDRVVGYFRSSSLAIASQGFSAFTSAGGIMRLVVGTDLDEEDVAAILAGDSRRMADRLNDELGEPDSWPEDVTLGMELLAWMVARSHLEVRVAFRVHGKSGRPLDFSATEDGYVHEKWAIFTDSDGNRLYISGSLNESRTALVLNAENIDVHADWWSDIERQRADDAQTAFENIWNDRTPYLRVMTLPEAVKKRLIEIGRSVTLPSEVDASTDWAPSIEPPSAMERLQFALIRNGPKLPGGRFVGMETAPVTPWPHQDVVARRLIETWPYNFLLCDEVGLGKTIEAGLAIRSLVLSGLARRVLIVPPASLTKQWHREMAAKFFLPFGRASGGASVRHEYIFPKEETRPSTGLYKPDLCIISTGLLNRKERKNDLMAAGRFDIVLVDEAHYARRENPAARDNCRVVPRFSRLYEIIRGTLRKRSECLWLATATPMQLDWIEVYDLIHLTDRVGPFQNDLTLTRSYYDALERLVRNQSINAYQWEFLQRAVKSIDRHDPFLWKYFNEAVIDGRIRTIAHQWLERGRIPRGADLRHIRRLMFSAAPLSRVMLRHTRPLLDIYRDRGQMAAKLAKREILPIPRIVFTPLEQKAYEELETFCAELTEQIQRHSDENLSTNSLKFLLSLLRLRFASSLYAIRETLRRRRERVAAPLKHQQSITEPDIDISDMESVEYEDVDEKSIETLLKNRSPEDLEWEHTRLAGMVATMEDLSETPSKMKALLDILGERQKSGRIRQTVIFTRFYDTLTDIVNRLRRIDTSMLIGTYSGRGGQYVDPKTRQLRGVDREEVKHRFLRNEIDVLICTDAAAEGLNLQTADLLINFDLPWNPMKVEQRIGRIDRIGQQHDVVSVLNLCYTGSVEETVYGRLLRRLSQIDDVVGAQQISILPVSDEDFRQLADREITPEQLEQLARERMAVQHGRTASMEIPAGDLYDIYTRMRETRAGRPSPMSLDAIWQAITGAKYLRDLGCTVSHDQQVITLRGLDVIPDGTMMTVDRSLYDQGLPDETQRLHFASYGNPFFHAVLHKFEDFGLPECMCRLSEKVEGLHVEVIAYAVACIGDDGRQEIRLSASWADLQGLVLDEEICPQDADLSALKKRLHERVHSEFSPTVAVAGLEKDNRRVACAQEILDLLLMQSLLKYAEGTALDNYWKTISVIEGSSNNQDSCHLPHLQAPAMRRIKDDLLFDAQVPTLGPLAGITSPSLLTAAALDAGCRLANSMKKKKADITVRDVLNRLDREIQKKLKEFG